MKKLYQYIDEVLNNHKSRSYVLFNTVLSVITVASILTIILETVQSLHRYNDIFFFIEWFTVIFFTIEYFLRIITADKKTKYVFGFWGITDLVSVIPTYLGLGNFTFLKSIRVLRVLRLLRIIRMTKIIHLYATNIEHPDSQAELNRQNIRVYFFTLVASIVLSGSILYAIEHTQAYYANIPLSMLQGAKILLGESPAPAKSLLGEIAMIIIKFIGLALFGLLIGIIGTNLNQLIFGDQPVKGKKLL